MTIEPTQELHINPEYQDLICPLSKEEYELLKTSIREQGQHIPIIVNTEGVIIDGINRTKVCQELRITPKIEIRVFEDELEEKLCVIDCNLKRRHLTDAQKIEIGHKIKPTYQELARRNQSLAGKSYGSGKNSSVSNDTQLSAIGRVYEVVAKEIGLSTSLFQRGETILVKYPEAFEKHVKKAGMPINRVHTKLKLQEKRIKLREDALEVPLIDRTGVKLIQGDFIEASKEISDNSIDLIFCDPPYSKEYLPLYGELAKLADRILKPGASLVAYTGCFNFPDVIDQIRSNSSLKWNWQLVILHTGPTEAMQGPKVFVRYKPLLWFVKERNNAPEYITDVIVSHKPDKIAHDWEQSTVEAGQCISRLTLENQIVFDPMMGSGTTGEAAVKLKRQFIGIEINSETYKIAQYRISNTTADANAMDVVKGTTKLPEVDSLN